MTPTTALQSFTWEAVETQGQAEKEWICQRLNVVLVRGAEKCVVLRRVAESVVRLAEETGLPSEREALAWASAVGAVLEVREEILALRKAGFLVTLADFEAGWTEGLQLSLDAVNTTMRVEIRDHEEGLGKRLDLTISGLGGEGLGLEHYHGTLPTPDGTDQISEYVAHKAILWAMTVTASRLFLLRDLAAAPGGAQAGEEVSVDPLLLQTLRELLEAAEAGRVRSLALAVVGGGGDHRNHLFLTPEDAPLLGHHLSSMSLRITLTGLNGAVNK